MKKKAYIIGIFLTLSICLLSKVNAQWRVTGNTLTATGKIGTLNNFGINLITNNETRMFIKNTGEIGIGTLEPNNKLCINGGLSIDCKGLNNGQLENGLRFGAGKGRLGLAGISSDQTGGSGNRYGLNFFTENKIRFAITATGRVGIGTTNPAALLDVEGGDIVTSGSVTSANISASGNVNATSTIHASGKVSSDGEFHTNAGRITGNATGGSNLIPVAYLKVRADGSIASSSGNIQAVIREGKGNYIIGITGFTFNNTSVAMGTVCSQSNSKNAIILTEPADNGFNLRVKIRSATGWVGADNVDEDFCIVIYQP